MKFTHDMDASYKTALLMFVVVMFFINVCMVLGCFLYYKNHSKAEEVAERILNDELYVFEKVEEADEYLQ
jgi:hypothetical protein